MLLYLVGTDLDEAAIILPFPPPRDKVAQCDVCVQLVEVGDVEATATVVTAARRIGARRWRRERGWRWWWWNRWSGCRRQNERRWLLNPVYGGEESRCICSRARHSSANALIRACRKLASCRAMRVVSSARVSTASGGRASSGGAPGAGGGGRTGGGGIPLPLARPLRVFMEERRTRQNVSEKWRRRRGRRQTRDAPASTQPAKTTRNTEENEESHKTTICAM